MHNGELHTDRHGDSLLHVFGDHTRYVDGKTRFVGVAISAIDQFRVAVAVSGVVTLLADTKALGDALPMDILLIGSAPSARRPRLSQGRVPFIQPKIVVAGSQNDIEGRRVVGVLLNIGRAPVDEARVLLLPGLEHLPAPPSEYVDDSRSEAASEDMGADLDATEFTSAYNMTTNQILDKLQSKNFLDLKHELQCVISQIENRLFNE